MRVAPKHDGLVERGHPDLRSSPDPRQRFYVSQRLGKNVARAGEPGLVAARDRGPPVAERDTMTLRPIGNLARDHYGASCGLARDVDRDLEVNLLAPGHRR